MAEENDSTVAGMIGLEEGDISRMQALLPFLYPVSPWLGLGLGGAMGLYSYMQAKEDTPKQREHAAGMAEIAHLTGQQPQQTYFQDPSLVGHMLGGLQGGMGVADSINAFGPALAFKDYLANLQETRAAKQALREENAGILGRGQGPLSDQGVAEYDATLASDAALAAHPFGGQMPQYRGQFPHLVDPPYASSPYEYMDPGPSRGDLRPHQEGPPYNYYNYGPDLAGMTLPQYLGE